MLAGYHCNGRIRSCREKNKYYHGPKSSENLNSQFSFNFKSPEKRKRSENKLLLREKQYNGIKIRTIHDRAGGYHHSTFKHTHTVASQKKTFLIDPKVWIHHSQRLKKLTTNNLYYSNIHLN